MIIECGSHEDSCKFILHRANSSLLFSSGFLDLTNGYHRRLQVFAALIALTRASFEEDHGGSTYHETSKPVEIPIYKKYAIPIPHPVPVPIPQQIKVPIPQPYQVEVPVPHPVPVEVVKHVEIPVEKPEPYVVEKKVRITFSVT